jgi:hypothetical protein
MRPRVDELESIVRSRICAVCSQRGSQESCAPEDAGGCSLFQLFPLVAQAILATDSPDLEDYLRAIRENVCAVCLEQALDGSCERRGGMRCALDSYLPQVVAIIEEASGRRFERRKVELLLGAEH